MRIKELRRAKGLTVKDVADALSVCYAAVFRWETGQFYPTADKLPKLARLFGCTIDDLFLWG